MAAPVLAELQAHGVDVRLGEQVTKLLPDTGGPRLRRHRAGRPRPVQVRFGEEEFAAIELAAGRPSARSAPPGSATAPAAPFPARPPAPPPRRSRSGSARPARPPARSRRTPPRRSAPAPAGGGRETGARGVG